MSAPHGLPVLMPNVPNQRWSCHSCGHCCRSLVGHLFPEEKARLEEQGWDATLGMPAAVRLGPGWVLNKKADESCVFLDEHNRCRVHARFGEAAKPLACRIFPFSVRPVRRGWQVSFRFDCPSSTASKGKPIVQYTTWLRDLAGRLEHSGSSRDDVVELEPGIRGTEHEVDVVIDRYTRWVQDGAHPASLRLIGIARLTTMLYAARFAKVRGQRFSELFDVLMKALSGECEAVPEAPTARQEGLLRQLAFAHAEHVSHAEATGGLGARWRRRWIQLRTARAFLKGRGTVPHLPGFDEVSAFSSSASTGEERTTYAEHQAVALGPDSPAHIQASHASQRWITSPAAPAFSAVPDVTMPSQARAQTEELLIRYLAARLQGRSCFGDGYYGWPVFAGLGALCLSLAAAGWLARYRAARGGRNTVSLDDYSLAIGVVDRAATRLPALGKSAERVRLAYLIRDDGLARLLHRYSV